VITTKRKYLAAAGLLGFTGLLALLFYCAPDRYSFYPQCLFHSLTGLQCPGCGGLRATHYLLHGDVAAAFRLNQLFVLLLPFLLLFGATRLVKQVSGRDWLEPFWHPFWLWAVLVVVVLFTILRNLP